MTTDASGKAICRVLSQEGHPVIYVSRKLSQAKQNSSNFERKALAIVFVATRLEKFLLRRRFILQTADKPLKYLFASDEEIPKTASSRITRWAIALMGFNFELKYTSAEQIPHADAFSRLDFDVDDSDWLSTDSQSESSRDKIVVASPNSTEENSVNEGEQPSLATSRYKKDNRKDLEKLLVQTCLKKREVVIFAFQYNPAFQPRAIVVLGCISRTATDMDIRALLQILTKVSITKDDIDLIEAIIICLTRVQSFLPADFSLVHQSLFWVAVAVMQLDDIGLYSAGLSLMEMNLTTLDAFGLFSNKTPDEVYSDLHPVMEWHFKQIEHTVGLSFRNNFHFALVAHLLKGFRHPHPDVVNRTQLVLDMMLTLISKLKSQRRTSLQGSHSGNSSNQPSSPINNMSANISPPNVNNSNSGGGNSISERTAGQQTTGNNSSVYGSQGHADGARNQAEQSRLNGSNGSTQNNLQQNIDKFNVCRENIAYLAALLPVSSEVQARLKLRYKNYRVSSFANPALSSWSFDAGGTISPGGLGFLGSGYDATSDAVVPNQNEDRPPTDRSDVPGQFMTRRVMPNERNPFSTMSNHHRSHNVLPPPHYHYTSGSGSGMSASSAATSARRHLSSSLHTTMSLLPPFFAMGGESHGHGGGSGTSGGRRFMMSGGGGMRGFGDRSHISSHRIRSNALQTMAFAPTNGTIAELPTSGELTPTTANSPTMNTSPEINPRSGGTGATERGQVGSGIVGTVASQNEGSTNDQADNTGDNSDNFQDINSPPNETSSRGEDSTNSVTGDANNDAAEDDDAQSATNDDSTTVSAATCDYLFSETALPEYNDKLLLLTILATMLRNTADENEYKVLFEYLAEASLVFPRIFPLVYTLIDQKMSSTLTQSVDIDLINAAQSIVYNIFAQQEESTSGSGAGAGGGGLGGIGGGGGTPHHHHSQHTNLQAIGFGGFWRFAQSFNKSGASSNMDNVDMFTKFVHVLLNTVIPSASPTQGNHAQLTTPRVNTLLSMSLSSISSAGALSLTGFDNDDDLLA
ncbi:uncharacterized protein LOC142347998 [Convolutriloba macropyga]|uniref:uncharacterized protein LOC142347998 n=1 Tax=Convolutriloba macropyga TaxID=536237 RepID=UPI003F528282